MYGRKWPSFLEGAPASRYIVAFIFLMSKSTQRGSEDSSAPGYEARTCSNRREILQASVQMWHFMAQKITGIRSALKGFLGQGWEGSMLSDPLNAA